MKTRTSELQRNEPLHTFAYKWATETPRPNEGYDDYLFAFTLPIVSIVLLSLPGQPNYCLSSPVANATLPWPSPLDSVDRSVACVWLGTRFANAPGVDLSPPSGHQRHRWNALGVWDLSRCHKGTERLSL